jgi:SrtB family sortase
MKQKQTARTAFINVLRDFIPVVQDPPREWVRKLAFLMALVVFIGAGWYLLDDMWVQPQKTEATINNLRDWYYAEDGGNVTLPEQNGTEVTFPDGMMPNYQTLYRANPEVRGWIRFAAGEGEDDLFDGCIDNPIVQTSDNDYYLDHNFEGAKALEGTLFLDGMNRLVPEDDCLIVYGHNMKNRTMFGQLSAYGDISHLRQYPVVHFDTVYENRSYVAFAAFSASMKPGDAHYFDVCNFIFDQDGFDKFVLKLQSRSVFKSPVDVRYGDRLLLLVTCDYSNREGRFILALRQLRADENEGGMFARMLGAEMK